MDEIKQQGSPEPTEVGGVFVTGTVGTSSSPKSWRWEPQVPMTGRLVLGLVVISLGVLFTLDNLGVIDAGELLRWWPALILSYGLVRLFGIFTRPNFMAGMIFFLIGGWLLLNSLDMIHLDFFGFWSIVLIILGVAIVSSALRGSRAQPASGTAASTFSAFAFMSGTERVITSPDFRGGDIIAVMGGHKIDLRPARIASGVATIDLLVWWGGVDIIVPDDWEVSNEGLALMGAIEDTGTASTTTPTERLVLRGVTLMGGVEVKRKPR
jgi:predicted membrane protein